MVAVMFVRRLMLKIANGRKQVVSVICRVGAKKLKEI